MIHFSLPSQKTVPQPETHICLKTRESTSKFLIGKSRMFLRTPEPGRMPDEHGSLCSQQQEKFLLQDCRILKHLNFVEDFQHGVFFFLNPLHPTASTSVCLKCAHGGSWCSYAAGGDGAAGTEGSGGGGERCLCYFRISTNGGINFCTSTPLINILFN